MLKEPEPVTGLAEAHLVAVQVRLLAAEHDAQAGMNTEAETHVSLRLALKVRG
ncbi:hypothetical protein ACFVGV_00700 [Pseudarthrobacter scleromae]|uniref:hypothetical protein n=1 Tax=Pseudarthrobacter scleromae TaxID=158897 RepID=UPI0036356954